MSKFHYVYRITNTIENKHYYGVRTSKVEPKLDLGFKYFSSSKDKAFISDQRENKDDYKYKVIKIFSSREEAIECYREYITNGEGKHLLNDLWELKDKILGCWCHPEPCHGDILIELVSDDEFIKAKKQTRFGKLISGTKYGDYSIENEFLQDNKVFIKCLL